MKTPGVFMEFGVKVYRGCLKCLLWHSLSHSFLELKKLTRKQEDNEVEHRMKSQKSINLLEFIKNSSSI